MKGALSGWVFRPCTLALSTTEYTNPSFLNKLSIEDGEIHSDLPNLLTFYGYILVLLPNGEFLNVVIPVAQSIFAWAALR